jgi:formylmethanofuran dehydrogenase subunit C
MRGYINAYPQAGIDVTVTDVKETPAAFVWGKLKRSISDFGVITIRGDMDANARDVVDVDIQASGFFGTGIQILGSAGT